MAAFVFANNVSTTLAAASSSTSTTFTLASSTNLPTLASGQMMPLTLNDVATGLVYEIVYVTDISGATLTVERAQEGTTAQNWNVGDYAFVAPTAGTDAPSGGNPANTFLVANGASGNDAINYGQTVDYVTGVSADQTISPTAFETVVLTNASAAITVTLDPGTVTGQSVRIIGSSGGVVTVASSVSSGNPFFVLPDGSTTYSVALAENFSAAFIGIWDSTNWRVTTTGLTIVAPGTSGSEAVNYSQVANVSPVGVGGYVGSGTSLTLTTGTLTAPSNGFAFIIYNSQVGGSNLINSISVSASLGSLTTVAEINYGGYGSTAASSMLPMTAGQASTFTLTIGTSSSTLITSAISAVFVPQP